MLQNKAGPVQQKAAKGYLSGMMVFEFLSANMPSIAAAAGADFLMYDMEHTGITTETLRVQMAACRGLDIVPLVRVPSAEANIVGQILDIGAHGIMVPMVETAAQAEDIVRRAHYPPEGQRGTAFSISHDEFTAGHPVEKMKQANAQTLVIVMIETVEGLKNVDQIAAVPGVHVLWLGHFDLTSSMGIAGQLDHPDYTAAVKKISTAAAINSKLAGYMAMDKEFAAYYWNEGYRKLAYGLDHLLLMAALKDGLGFIDKLADTETS